MTKIFILIIKLYKFIISPFMTPCCRFQPSCSEYALQAFQERGWLLGLRLTTSRLLRCQPLATGGYDPLPKANDDTVS